MNQELKLREFFFKIARDIFLISLISLVVFFVLENFKSGFVSNYFNLNIGVAIFFLSGGAAVFLAEERTVQKPKSRRTLFLLFVLVSIIGAFLVWQSLRAEGWIGWLAALGAGILIFLVQWSLSFEDFNIKQ